MSRLAISSASLNILFSETFHYNRPVAPAKQIFFCPISGMEFDHFWNWFGKNKFPGALQLLK